MRLTIKARSRGGKKGKTVKLSQHCQYNNNDNQLCMTKKVIDNQLFAEMN